MTSHFCFNPHPTPHPIPLSEWTSYAYHPLDSFPILYYVVRSYFLLDLFVPNIFSFPHHCYLYATLETGASKTKSANSFHDTFGQHLSRKWNIEFRLKIALPNFYQIYIVVAVYQGWVYKFCDCKKCFCRICKSWSICSYSVAVNVLPVQLMFFRCGSLGKRCCKVNLLSIWRFESAYLSVSFLNHQCFQLKCEKVVDDVSLLSDVA